MKGIQIQLPCSSSQNSSEKPDVDLQALITSFNSEHKQFRWNRLGSKINKNQTILPIRYKFENQVCQRLLWTTTDVSNSLSWKVEEHPPSINTYYDVISCWNRVSTSRSPPENPSAPLNHRRWRCPSFLPPHRLRGWCEETFIGLSVGERAPDVGQHTSFLSIYKSSFGQRKTMKTFCQSLLSLTSSSPPGLPSSPCNLLIKYTHHDKLSLHLRATTDDYLAELFRLSTCTSHVCSELWHYLRSAPLLSFVPQV